MYLHQREELHLSSGQGLLTSPLSRTFMWLSFRHQMVDWNDSFNFYRNKRYFCGLDLHNGAWVCLLMLL